MFVAHKTFGRFCMATTLWFVVFFCLTFVSFLALRLQSCSFHFDHSDLYICIWAHNSQAGKCTYTYFSLVFRFAALLDLAFIPQRQLRLELVVMLCWSIAIAASCCTLASCTSSIRSISVCIRAL